MFIFGVFLFSLIIGIGFDGYGPVVFLPTLITLFGGLLWVAYRCDKK